ncbi:hypothetical protein QBC38DRAFT_194623 [Podospora fimiseda]|uniref:Chitin-binding type-1 domain-containing protein n=1 Tax=Podospora fimiseda TaxID=252190 RepID=A0AAN7GYV5_9PEZI|nr:hypothetical protein QBC38DRAFT_194623 [Podospora fimiseda]
MRTTLISLATAALCWTGALAADNSRNGSLSRRGLSKSLHRRNMQLGIHARQSSGRCGAGVGRCPDNQCCSDYGFCGLTVDHCHPLFDCQTQYGVCGWPPPAPVESTTSTTSTSTSTSTTPTPTPTSTSTSTTPTPTSISTTSTTSTTPIVIPPSSTSSTSIPIPTGPLVITQNGQCGNGTICIGNPNYGPCCSQFFWCGSSMDFCGAGCRSDFGACFGIPGLPGTNPGNGTISTPPVQTPTSTSTTSSTTSTTSIRTTTSTTSTTTSTTSTTTSTTSTTSAAPTPSFVLPPGQRSSTDGRCGNGVNCLGSNFGRCCSQFGYCGDGDQYCPYIVGCQSEFGYCEPGP